MVPTKFLRPASSYILTVRSLNDGFKFQDYLCNGCHDLRILSDNISDITIITVKNVDYCCIIHNVSKSEVINLLKKSVLENRGFL